jgi:Spy/CpxP family protein refolding chaperone
MKRIAIALALLVGGTTVAHANPPGLSPGPAPIAPYAQEAGPGEGRMGPRGKMGRGKRDGARMGKQHRLPPQLRAKLVAMFDRDQDGRLDKREKRAAKRFVKRAMQRRARHGGGPRGAS